MKKNIIAVAAITMLLSATSAFAATTMGGLGFRTLNGPSNLLDNANVSFSVSPAVGVRQWLTEKVGFDAAIGFSSLESEQNNPSLKLDKGTGFVFDIGMPVVLKKMDKVNFIVRPGLTYGTATATDKTLASAPNEFETKLMSFSGEFEVEFMLTDNLSISAAHGISYSSVKVSDNSSPSNEIELKGFETTGNNFTQLGFHVYLW